MRASHVTGSSLTEPSDQVTATLCGSAARASAPAAPLATSTCPTWDSSTLATSRARTVTESSTGASGRHATLPCSTTVPACAKAPSGTAHSTASSVTSPFDHVTCTAWGKSGLPPTQISCAAGVVALTAAAGATLTATLTVWPVWPTAPYSSNCPPSREASTPSCSALKASHATGSSLTEPSDQLTGTVWGRDAITSEEPEPLATCTTPIPDASTPATSRARTSMSATTCWSSPSTAPTA